MIAYRRAVRFQEVDAAQMAFFPNFAVWAHEAMEHFFGDLAGGYAALITQRRVGLPAVKFDVEFRAPLVFGDAFVVETRVARIGGRSLTMSYRFVRERDGVVCAEASHVVVTTDLDALKSCEMPEDVRAHLEAHLDRGASGHRG